MIPVPHGSTAVMARRVEPPDSLDFFPTPPWATRALMQHVMPAIGLAGKRFESVWEPACGEGHMAEVLREYFGEVLATDVYDYGYGDEWDFLSDKPLVNRAGINGHADWIITNPPFKCAVDFTLIALKLASHGVAMLVRTQWIESVGRYESLFRDTPPTVFAPFVERVPIVKGCWDPRASTATSYAWFVWLKDHPTKFQTMLIPPGCRRELTKPTDVKRFTKSTTGPLV